MQVKGGAARHQHVDAVAEDALNRIGDLALEVGPHDEVKALAGSVFDGQPVFLAEPAPADFRCPVEEVALLLGHLAAHHQDLIVRVWGWSGHFVQLDKGYQDQIIQRTSYREA